MEYAGFWRRFAAYIVDFLVLSIPLAAVAFVVPGDLLSECGSYVETVTDQDGLVSETTGYRCETTWLADLITIVIIWFYFALLESSKRQATLGKMMIGAIVTDLDGNRISLGRAMGRNLGKIVSWIIIAIGFMMAGFTKRKQALHDIMAGCLVIRKPKSA
jgi:uncharacterized RDD family membrane protein YckC